jgi:hypothetical protein
MAEPEFNTRAEAYVALALWGIKLSRSANGLRSWWVEEQPKREEYEMSKEQESVLIAACREHIATLEANAEETAPAEPERRRPKPRPRQMPLI